MTDILDTFTSQLNERQAELRPLIAEYKLLSAAAAALDGAYAPPPCTISRSVGRPKGSGKRVAEVLAAITQQPGITSAELADQTGTRADYVGVLLRGLVNEGKIIKNEGFKPA